MKIYQLVSSGGFYGLEAVVLTLCRAYRQMGHRVTLGVFRNEHNPQLELADQARASGLDVDVIPCRGQIDIGALRHLRARVHAFGPDILHSHGYKSDIYAWAAGFHRTCGLVATAHNWTNASSHLRLYGALDKAALRAFARVFCVSDDVRRILLGSGLRPGALVTIRNGIDLSHFACAAPSLRDELPPEAAVVGMVGRLVRDKGFHSVLELAPGILKRHPRTFFVLVGTGPDEDSLRALAARLGIDSHVYFAGKRTDMPAVYRSFDMLVLPSRNEGTPMVVLEAMASALPVIATRVGALPAIVEHERTGILIDPGNLHQLKQAIETLLGNHDLRQAMGGSGQEWLQANGSIQSTAETYLSHYAQVCSPAFLCHSAAQ